MREIIFLPTQLPAGMVATSLVSCMFPGDIRAVNTTLGPATAIAQSVFIEMFLTCELVFTVPMLAAEKSKDTFLAPVGIRLALFAAELADESGSLSFFLRQVMRRDKGLTGWIECVYYTGGSLNPTRSFGLLLPGLGFLNTTRFTRLGYFWAPRFRRGIIVSWSTSTMKRPILDKTLLPTTSPSINAGRPLGCKVLTGFLPWS